MFIQRSFRYECSPTSCIVWCTWSDKNATRVDLATERFKEISDAYNVLSDPQERAWYDSHREAILRGGDGTATGPGDSDMELMSLWEFFSVSCFGGMNDDADGFFTVYVAPHVVGKLLCTVH